MMQAVQNLPEQTLAAIGRMTVAATDLEYLLAWIGADGDGGDVFARPGEPLAAARRAAQSSAGEVRQEMVVAGEAAATQLALSQAALRRLWREDSPTAATTFDGITGQLVTVRDWLAMRVAETVSG